MTVLTTMKPLLERVPSPVPRRQRRLTGRHALVDGIPYTMPVNSDDSPVLMAAFPISRRAAAEVLPSQLHPLDIGLGRGLLVVTVVNYRSTDIGRYIEYSLAIAVTHGPRPAPPLLPALLRKTFGVGQYVVDLPVSSEISVKGGKGIWGMPKHRASLDFVVTDSTVSAQYDADDGALACLVEIERPPAAGLPLKLAAVNYCSFRGMLMKSTIYFEARADVAFGRRARARLELGTAAAVAPLRTLRIGQKPLFTAYLPTAVGVLDDHYEGWFLTSGTAQEAATAVTGDRLESVVGLGLGEEWPPPPVRGAATRVEAGA